MRTRSGSGVRSWFLRIGVLVLLVAALATAIAYMRFAAWKAEHLHALEAGSKVVATARGDMEYAVQGEGVPHLWIHGSPGGYENALAGRGAYPNLYTNVMTIGASRPGYLRTPLSSGETFEAQADLVAALLDELHIERAVIVASSGGGYVGLQFALRHPQRCVALVLMSPSISYEPNAEGPPPRGLWIPMEFAMWAAGRSVGDLMMKGFDRHDPRQAAVLQRVMPTHISRRVPGAINDGLQRRDPGIDRWPLERISVPTLLIHGDADENSDYAGSVRVAAQVPGARLVTFEGGDHYLPITRLEEVQAHVRAFVAASMLHVHQSAD
jgi:pimeloyl-ACP methyl ester carboxylesterase